MDGASLSKDFLGVAGRRLQSRPAVQMPDRRLQSLSEAWNRGAAEGFEHGIGDRGLIFNDRFCTYPAQFPPAKGLSGHAPGAANKIEGEEHTWLGSG
jgi:hypothetical protein